MKLINTVRWRKLRRQKLKAQPWCERCEKEGRLAAATEVHHVRPVETASNVTDMARLMYDYGNLQSLCHACHVKTHEELGKGTKEEIRQRQTARLEDFRQRFPT